MKQCNSTGGIYCFADKVNAKRSKGKQKKKAAANSSNPRVDHGYLACQYHRVIVTGLAWIEGFVTTGTVPLQFCILFLFKKIINWKGVMIIYT